MNAEEIKNYISYRMSIMQYRGVDVIVDDIYETFLQNDLIYSATPEKAEKAKNIIKEYITKGYSANKIYKELIEDKGLVNSLKTPKKDEKEKPIVPSVEEKPQEEPVVPPVEEKPQEEPVVPPVEEKIKSESTQEEKTKSKETEKIIPRDGVDDEEQKSLAQTFNLQWQAFEKEKSPKGPASESSPLADSIDTSVVESSSDGDIQDEIMNIDANNIAKLCSEYDKIESNVDGLNCNSDSLSIPKGIEGYNAEGFINTLHSKMDSIKDKSLSSINEIKNEVVKVIDTLAEKDEEVHDFNFGKLKDRLSLKNNESVSFDKISKEITAIDLYGNYIAPKVEVTLFNFDEDSVIDYLSHCDETTIKDIKKVMDYCPSNFNDLMSGFKPFEGDYTEYGLGNLDFMAKAKIEPTDPAYGEISQLLDSVFQKKVKEENLIEQSIINIGGKDFDIVSILPDYKNATFNSYLSHYVNRALYINEIASFPEHFLDVVGEEFNGKPDKLILLSDSIRNYAVGGFDDSYYIDKYIMYNMQRLDVPKLAHEFMHKFNRYEPDREYGGEYFLGLKPGNGKLTNNDVFKKLCDALISNDDTKTVSEKMNLSAGDYYTAFNYDKKHDVQLNEAFADGMGYFMQYHNELKIISPEMYDFYMNLLKIDPNSLDENGNWPVSKIKINGKEIENDMMVTTDYILGHK